MRIPAAALAWVTFLGLICPVPGYSVHADSNRTLDWLSSPIACVSDLLSPEAEIIKLDRLTLRPARWSDTPFLWRMINDSENAEFYFALPEPPKLNVKWDILQKFIKGSGLSTGIESNELVRRFNFLIEDEQGRTIGLGNLLKANRRGSSWNIGYAILPEARRRGHARELLESVMRTVRKTNPDASFRAATLPSNLASISLLKKIGFKESERSNHEPSGLTLVILELKGN